jgi:hypothetical protein
MKKTTYISIYLGIIEKNLTIKRIANECGNIIRIY